MEGGGQFHNNQPMASAFKCMMDDMERRRREETWRKYIVSHFSSLFRPSETAWAPEMVKDTVVLDAYRLGSPDRRTECFSMAYGRSNIERTRWFGAQ